GGGPNVPPPRRRGPRRARPPARPAGGEDGGAVRRIRLLAVRHVGGVAQGRRGGGRGRAAADLATRPLAGAVRANRRAVRRRERHPPPVLRADRSARAAGRGCGARLRNLVLPPPLPIDL